jgi:hypothetical protein
MSLLPCRRTIASLAKSCRVMGRGSAYCAMRPVLSVLIPTEAPPLAGAASQVVTLCRVSEKATPALHDYYGQQGRAAERAEVPRQVFSPRNPQQ